MSGPDGSQNRNTLDISENRRRRKWSLGVQVARMLWAVVWPLAGLVPRPFWGWRRLVLRLFGAKVGPDAHIYPTARITMPWNIKIGAQAAVGDRAILYALGPVRIGARATVSQHAHLCAGSHDMTKAGRPLIRPPVTIEADAWIAADSFVGPGVTIGAGAVVGARSVVMRDVEPWTIVAGNPARVLRSLPSAS